MFKNSCGKIKWASLRQMPNSKLSGSWYWSRLIYISICYVCLISCNLRHRVILLHTPPVLILSKEVYLHSKAGIFFMILLCSNLLMISSFTYFLFHLLAFIRSGLFSSIIWTLKCKSVDRLGSHRKFHKQIESFHCVLVDIGINHQNMLRIFVHHSHQS